MMRQHPGQAACTSASQHSATLPQDPQASRAAVRLSTRYLTRHVAQ